MKTLYKLLTVIVFVIPSSLAAQKMPSESPKTTVSQRVGLSDVTITYGRPGVKGRKIFGTLVPYGEVWRTGADWPTFITFKDTTYIEGKQNRLLPAKYALYTIPGKDRWTIIFSKDTSLWGAYGYKPENDALRVEVKAGEKGAFTESFLITFTDVSDNEARIHLQWENTSVTFGVYADIGQRIMAHVQQRILTDSAPDWSIYWQGAKWILADGGDLKHALEWINTSVKLEELWINTWTKAQIHAALGDYKNAVAAGNKAIEIGTREKEAPYFPYRKVYATEIEKWKKKI